MRKLLPYLGLITILLVGAGAFFMPEAAHAQGAVGTVLNWVTGGTNFVYGIVGKVIWWLAVPITGLLVYLAGSMIDVIIALTSSQAFFDSPAIETSWGILRDIANMVFIFILIYHGIQLILGIDGVSTKKTITGVILAAVFINFSLFMTKAVMDVSNITAAWFIEGIYSLGGERSVGGTIRSSLNMTAIANTSNGASATQLANFGAELFSAGIAAIVINCIAAWIFFQVFFLLLARLVTFVFLIITAPIGFIGFLLPQLKDYGEQWWSELQKQAMLAPMFFLMLYITLYLADQTNALIYDTGTTSLNTVTGSRFSVANYVMFALIVMMLYKILDTAKKYSGEMGGKLGGILKSGIMFAAGGVAMGTLGKAANFAQNSKGFQKFAANSGVLSRAAMVGVKSTADSSFGVSSNLKNLGAGNIPGMKNAFKGAEKGYSGKIAAEKKSEEEFGKLLGKGLEGAQNRQAYAQGLGLYNRVLDGAAKKANALGGKVAKVAGNTAHFAVGEIVPGIGNETEKLVNKTVGATTYVAKATLNDRGSREASKEMEDKAKDDIAKESGKLADEALKAYSLQASTDPEMKDLLVKLLEKNSAINKSLEGMDPNSAEYKTMSEAKDAVKKMEGLESERKSLEERLKTFDESSLTIGGIKTEVGSFKKELEKLNVAIAKTNGNIEDGRKNAPALAQEKWKAESAIKERGDSLAQQYIKYLKDKKVKLQSDTLEAIKEIAKEGKKKRDKEEIEKLKKNLDKAMNPEQKEEEKPKGGGDDEKKEKKP